MVDFKKKIKEQKRKDRERAGKKRKSVSGDRVSKMDAPSIGNRKKNQDSTDAIMKGVADLFKKDDDDLYANSTATAKDFTTNFGGSGFEVGGGYYKKGGRLKNAGKRKRAALRGQRSELRGS
tara:strand:+ start:570 stop:935 length:366 start_codon:yes stop_codon:yes gene_type:complete